jgi:glutathione S-transferase
MLKIWGRKNSVNAKKALWALEELEVPYERIDAGLQFGVVNTPEYRKMNPNGLVPTIDDEGFILWESHAIVRYLAAKHGAGGLWPTDLRVRADADRWMDWAFTFAGALRPVFWNLIRTPPDQRDAKLVAEGAQKAGELATYVDARLADRPYVAGESLTMGDIPLGCHLQIWFRLDIARPRVPHLQAWFERLCARPAYTKIVDLPLS